MKGKGGTDMYLGTDDFWDWLRKILGGKWQKITIILLGNCET